MNESNLGSVDTEFQSDDLKTDKSFNILQVNLQCIRNKLLELEHVGSSLDIDLICVSEHWLVESEINLFIPQGYMPASFYCRQNKKNGGAGIIIKNNIAFEVIDIANFSSELDCELCCVKLSEQNIYVVSVYRAPQGNIDLFFENFERAIKHVLNFGALVVVGGDFNIEMIKMESQKSISFANLLRSLNLIRTVNTPTRFNACIDNVLVNLPERLYRISSIDGHFADHQPNIIQILFYNPKDLPVNNYKSLASSKLSFRKQNELEIGTFLDHLSTERWEMINEFNSGTLNAIQVIDMFFKNYIHLWHLSSPLCLKNNKSTCNRKKKLNWYTVELANERKVMLNLFNVYKSLRTRNSVQTQLAYNAYLACKRSYKTNLTLAKKQACEEYIDAAPNSCKAAWDVIKHEHSPTSALEVHLEPNSLNHYFLTSVADLSLSIPPTNKSSSDLLGAPVVEGESFFWKEIMPDDVLGVVRKLSNSKSMDFYWLSNYVLKKTIESIKVPLAFILNRCLEFGYFPDLLKVSKVVPVFKKGDKSLPQNYRPISIVPVFSKVLESLMHLQLSSYFNHHNLISNCQFGFRAGRSTTSAVVEIVDHTLQSFENHETVALALLDLSKAFDSVPFSAIMEKFSYYGISEYAARIISSYLSNRKQYVSIRGSDSSVLKVTVGVPQGSVLGPFFFMVIINDLPKSLNVQSVIYADDTTLFSSNRDLVELNRDIVQGQSEAISWFSSNKLLCNQDKTQSILLSLANNHEAHSVKLLGINVDSKLNWSTHVESVCKKISRVCYLIWKLRDLLSPSFLRSSYFGLFQSHISYGLLLWGHSSSVSEILLIQKRVIRTMCNAEYRAHCRPLFIEMKILTVINLYIYHILIHTKTNLHLFSNRLDIHNHNTRNRHKLDIPQHRLTKTGTSHQVNCIKFFNKLHESAHNTSVNIFKKRILTWLQANPFYNLQEFMLSEVNLQF